MLSDEIYGTARKALSVFFLGSALVLPRGLRSRWLSAGLTHSRAKETLRKVARPLRRRLRRRKDP